MSEKMTMEAAMASKRAIPIMRDAETVLRHGIDALGRERIEEALGLLRQAVELAPHCTQAWLGLGIAATSALEIGEAMKALRTAIELEPGNFFAHFRLAQLYLRIGVPTLARQELETAMDLASDEGQRALVRQLLMIEKRREAKRIWRPDFSRLRRRGDKS